MAATQQTRCEICGSAVLEHNCEIKCEYCGFARSCHDIF